MASGNLCSRGEEILTLLSLITPYPKSRVRVSRKGTLLPRLVAINSHSNLQATPRPTSASVITTTVLSELQKDPIFDPYEEEEEEVVNDGGGEMGTAGLQKRGGNAGDKAPGPAVMVVVAVKAAEEIPRTALVWALTHVVQPSDCLTLLVVVPTHTPGRKIWGFPLFAGDCASTHKRLHLGTTMEQKADIRDLCSQMMLQLHDVYDPNKINIKIKIVPGSPCGAVAVESKRAQATWVVLDKQLKNEEKHCLNELQCNIVAMKRSQAKVLRLNLVRLPESEPQLACTLPSESDRSSGKNTSSSRDSVSSIRAPSVTPTSSPETNTPFSATEAGTSSVSTSSDPGTSPFFVSGTNEGLKKPEHKDLTENGNLRVTSSDSDSDSVTPPATLEFEQWVAEILSSAQRSSRQVEDLSHRFKDRTHISKANVLMEKFSKLDQEARACSQSFRSDTDFSGKVGYTGISSPSIRPDPNSSRNVKEAGTSTPSCGGSVREAISLSRNSPPGPPPLCSICQHKGPVFGKPPRWFSYAELELATGGFSQANFLAEGGYGSVYKGILPDGQAVAVKQHKLASSQGDQEFCSEVEVLSCAQHCNVVMLIGYCAEDKRRLLVYEYICNGSLHSHLYGRNKEPLEWSARQKIAVGAARGLRYLHEDCRVGCIVHRDMRPHNILLTHDFKPLVGDFGLARCQPNGDFGEETRVIGTIGYVAPEYSQTGQITEKADVYSFGVVLVELLTGRKAMDISRSKGQQLLTEWARPLLEEHATEELIDPCIGKGYSERAVLCMMHVALLCIRRDPHSRPRMSQVLRILEGNLGTEASFASTSSCDDGSRSGRMRADQHHQQSEDIGREHPYGGLMAAWERG